MDFHQHPSNNLKLGAPAGWNHDQVACETLPATHTKVDGQSVIISYWRPTADELRQLNEGGSVVLMVWGGLHPPVSLGTEAKV